MKARYPRPAINRAERPMTDFEKAGANDGARPWDVLVATRRHRVMSFIEDNLSRPISLAEMADAAGLSPFHFTRRFTKLTGMPPARYLWRRRVEMAKRVMRTTTLSLLSVALMCGFSTQSHFTTTFKRYTGVTPSQWRRSETDR